MIVIIQKTIPHYRLSFFNKLALKYDVTIIHTGPPVLCVNSSFKEYVLPLYNFGPFYFICGLSAILSQLCPSHVISVADFRCISIIKSMFTLDKSLKWIWWGLDMGNSFFANKLRSLLFKRGNSVIFYNDSIKNKFFGLNSKTKIFVANNTFDVSVPYNTFNELPKFRIVNIGTLNFRKRNDLLIRAIPKIISIYRSPIVFTFIGNGPELKKLLRIADLLNINSYVEFIPHTDDPLVLRKYYSESFLSVSVGQAGLAVLQSMAFGVPYITAHDAITGGERYNIIHNINGLFCDKSVLSVADSILSLLNNKPKLKQLSQNAFTHYISHCKMDQMISGFVSAIDNG